MVKNSSATEKLLLDKAKVEELLQNIARRMVAQHPDLSGLGLVGIRTKGTQLAEALSSRIYDLKEARLPVGTIDTTLYRDDVSVSNRRPVLCLTRIPFTVTGKRIILVDDVLYTGRTIRAALDALMDLGRPSIVQLAVLIDRGCRELPIQADYVGRVINTPPRETIKLSIDEESGECQVWLVEEPASRTW